VAVLLAAARSTTPLSAICADGVNAPTEAAIATTVTVAWAAGASAPRLHVTVPLFVTQIPCDAVELWYVMPVPSAIVMVAAFAALGPAFVAVAVRVTGVL
jgi:hypothetical protein